MRTCRQCGSADRLETSNSNGKGYTRSRCLDCKAKASREWRATPEGSEATKRVERRRKQRRAAGLDTEKWILVDTRRSDRKNGRENDLTREFIAEEIAKGCSYCGENGIRMTLDRIDNSKGHTQDNVISACIRCNYTRRDMPHEAWLVVAKGMREAREMGLFEGWTGQARRSGETVDTLGSEPSPL